MSNHLTPKSSRKTFVTKTAAALGATAAVASGVLLVTGAAGAATSPASPADVAAPASSATSYYVGTAVGSTADSSGTVYSAAYGFTGARYSTRLAAGTAVAGTSSPQLYRYGVFGMTGWSQTLPDATYTVTVKMAENYWKQAGKRVFDVTAEGTTELSNVDIYAAAGYRHAYDRTFTVTVTDGTLNLGFVAKADHPQIMGLSIVKTGGVAPDATNTGIPAGTKLTTHMGDLVVTTPGATYSNLDIHGYVTIKAPNVTIKNSLIRGAATPAPQGSWALVSDVTKSATNFLIEDSELVPDAPSMWVDGIKGFNYTAERLNIHGTVDTAKVYGDNATIEDSYLHDTIYYLNDPTASGNHTHNDGVQILSGNNIHILNNTIEGSNNSALQVTQNNGVVSNVWFQGNWADGGGCSVNLSSYPLPTMSGINVSYNKFGTHQRNAGCAIVSGPETALTAVGNIWAGSGLATKITRGL